LVSAENYASQENRSEGCHSTSGGQGEREEGEEGGTDHPGAILGVNVEAIGKLGILL